MLTTSPAKEIRGTVTLPPNPDYFFLAATLVAASGQTATISPVASTPLFEDHAKVFGGHLHVSIDGDTCKLTPLEDEPDICITLRYDELPFKDLSVFTLLGMGKTIVFPEIPTMRVEAWQGIAQEIGCSIETKDLEGRTGMYLAPDNQFTIPDRPVEGDRLHAYLGMAIGLRKKVSIVFEYTFSSPLRHILPALGYEYELKSNIEQGHDPIARRIRLMQNKKKCDGNQSFTFSCNFAVVSKEPAELTLPGDDVLGSLLMEAKSLVQRGNLIIENVPLETWNTSFMALIRKMGCRPGVQESDETSFGSVGMVQLQKFDTVGRKTECVPPFHYLSQLPSMVLLSCFSKGQSVFRELMDLRNENPDMIELILECVRAVGGRHGEMPDGIVIDGAKQWDGFDISKELPAGLAAACAVAGLKCMGTTSTADAALRRRWPDLDKLFDSICEYRK